VTGFSAAIGGAALFAALAQADVQDATHWYHHEDRHIVLYGNPSYLSDVQLDPNETVMTVALGDPAAWIVARGVAGPGGRIPHIFIKPKPAARDTNLEILTDRHQYMFWLVNDARHYTPRIAFYPTFAGPSRVAAAIPSPSAAPSAVAASVQPIEAPPAAAAAVAVAPEAGAPSPAPSVSPYDDALTPPDESFAPAVAPLAISAASASPIVQRSSPRLSAGHNQYAVSGPIDVSHVGGRTYLTLRDPLRRTPVAITTDAKGRHFPHVRHMGATYAMSGTMPALFVWLFGRERAHATLEARAPISQTFSEVRP
jgi:type IV secretion system protein VirB9